jgi:hypothetical protein
VWVCTQPVPQFHSNGEHFNDFLIISLSNMSHHPISSSRKRKRHIQDCEKQQSSTFVSCDAIWTVCQTSMNKQNPLNVPPSHQYHLTTIEEEEGCDHFQPCLYLNLITYHKYPTIYSHFLVSKTWACRDLSNWLKYDISQYHSRLDEHVCVLETLPPTMACREMFEVRRTHLLENTLTPHAFLPNTQKPYCFGLIRSIYLNLYFHHEAHGRLSHAQARWQRCPHRC